MSIVLPLVSYVNLSTVRYKVEFCTLCQFSSPKPGTQVPRWPYCGMHILRSSIHKRMHFVHVVSHLQIPSQKSCFGKDNLI